MKIRTKITGMGLLLVLLAAVSIVGIALYQEKILERNVGAEVEQLVRSETNRVAQDVYLMCRAMQETLDQMLAHGLKVAMEVGIRQGRLDFNSPASFTWQAVNQSSGESHRVVLSKVRFNDRWLGHNTDLTVPTPLVDEVSELQGVTCTVFQRMNEAGDMLRVATTVPNLDGSRAIGTYIPRYNPDGSPSPVIETLLRGEVFSGRAYVINAWYQTSYQPLWDASCSRVVGALYVGKKQESVTSLRRGILDIVIGKSGYVAIFGGQGEQRGKYLISKGGQRDGENIFKGDDLRLKPFRPVIDKAPSLGSDQPDKVIPTLYYKYPWQNPGEARSRRKSASIAYFEPWDWIIVATAYDDDYAESRQHMASALAHMIEWIAWVAAGVIVLSLLIGYYVTRGIVRPLDEAVAVFDRIGQGQLNLQLNVVGQDEIGQLSRSFNQMVVNLKEVTASRDELNHEIIERIRVENELRESEGKYRTLFNSSRDAIMILAPGDRFIDGNASVLQLFGCQNKEQFIRKTPADLSPEYQPDGALSSVKAQKMVALAMEKGSHFFEWKHQRVSGEEFFATVLLTRVHLRDKGILQATVRDVTERKLAEKKLKRYQDHLEELVAERTAELDKANQLLQQDILLREEAEDKLRAANHELEAFAYTVSHDLRTPLTPILGYADFLRREYRERLDEQALNCLAAITTAGEKMLAQMEDLLILARMGRLERPTEPVAASEVVGEVIGNLEKQIAESGVTVTQEPLPAIRVPGSVISQIFDNLIGNAVRYAGMKGSTIEVGGARKGARVRFFVRDHGPGIPEEERVRIFEVFTRGTSGKKLKGTGVGLATVLKIARTYRGRAWVEETPGGGSTFWVEMVDVLTATENEEDNLQGG